MTTTSDSRHPAAERLSEYVDGELTPSDREVCDAHLAGCAECARLLAELRAVTERARALPAVEPETDLWSGIESRLSAPVLDLGPGRARSDVRRARSWNVSWNLSLGQLASAAAVLVAITATVVWLVVGRSVPSGGNLAALEPRTAGGPAAETPAATPIQPAPAGESPGSLAMAPPSGAASASREGSTAGHALPATAADFGVARYDAAIAELETVLQAQRGKLDPKTVLVVERNLAVIDKAIADARSALAADPSSRYLNAYLASTMRRKVDLLRRVNDLTGSRI
jgi:hypothetical protein